MGGIHAARGKYIIMGDADDSYDFSRLELFVEELRKGTDLVMGNRFKGGVAPGAMPWLHKYIGNPVLSTIGKIFFRSPCNDFHCGLRGFQKKSIEELELITPGMEFASEMVVKATLEKLKIVEVPTTLSPDGRSRPPHLRSWRDGWRHLRFMALYNPRHLFVYPGLIMAAIGLVTSLSMIISPYKIFGIDTGPQRLLYMSMLFIVGLQFMGFGFFARYIMSLRLPIPANDLIERFMNKFTMEKGLAAGALFILLGIILFFVAFGYWGSQHFGGIDNTLTMRWVVPSVSLLIIGVQIIGSSLFLSSMRMLFTIPE
jgi:glycosyltransferase involved in cell wall biosynthesis